MMAPIIPGAWSSTWSFDFEEGEDAVDAEKTPRVPDSHTSYSGLSQQQCSRNIDLALYETPILSGRGVSVEEAVHNIGNDDASFADDASSVPSDDFYSIISHENTESTLFPSVIMSTSSISKEKDQADGLLGPLDFSSSHFDPSELSLCLHSCLLDDVHASGEPSEASILIPAVGPSIEDNSLVLEGVDSINALGLSLPNISARDEALALDALATIGAVTPSSGNSSPVDPHGYECDSSSSQEASFSISRDISSLMARLSAEGNVSRGSSSRSCDRSWSRSSSRNQRPRSTHHGHNDDALFRSRVSPLQLSQPNGDDPWTLSLDPTVSPTESETTSQISTASLSLDNGMRPDNERDSIISRDTFPSIASFHDSLASPRITPFEDEILTTPRGSESFTYRQPTQPKLNHGPSPRSHNPSNASVHSKNLMQKTKELCSKFKKFISLKAIKERRSKDTTKANASIRRTPLKNQVENNAPFHPQEFPRMTSESASSFETHHASRRTAKTSSPSVALSYTPNYTVSGRGSDEKYTYEYHARPKTLQEIKSKRRFSLPAFARPSSPLPPNPRPINPVPSTKERRARSILSAEAGMTR